MAREGVMRHVTEDALFWAHRAVGPAPELARPCACGGVVIADEADPEVGVRAHQASPRHRAWRLWKETNDDAT
jgi:hypothetical protein